MTAPAPQFDHDKLKVYQAAVGFITWLTDVVASAPKGAAVYSQLDRASTSIALNLAEGNGKHKPADRCRYFDTARGSAFECAACLDVLVAKQFVDSAVAEKGKGMLAEIVNMIVGLIRANSEERNI